MNKAILIGGYKAIGKSTLAKKYKNVIDVESSNYEYIIDDELKKLPIEERKGRKDRKKNPDYPLNYYNELVSNLHDDNIVLFACKKEVVKLLDDNNIDYYIVYPKEEMLDEIISRCQNRGNNENFVSRVREVYYNDYPDRLDRVLWLDNNQYIEDILIEKGIIEK